MAFLHVKTPNGTTQTLNLDTMNMQNGGDTRNGWWRFPNGMLVQYQHKYYSQMPLNADGVASWTLPILYWNTRLILTSIDNGAGLQDNSICIHSLNTNTINIVAFRNGTRLVSTNGTSFMVYIMSIDGPQFS